MITTSKAAFFLGFLLVSIAIAVIAISRTLQHSAFKTTHEALTLAQSHVDILNANLGAHNPSIKQLAAHSRNTDMIAELKRLLTTAQQYTFGGCLISEPFTFSDDTSEADIDRALYHLALACPDLARRQGKTRKDIPLNSL
jgi:hypothetical protein